MKLPFLINFMYIIAPLLHILIFWLGLKWIPRPQEDPQEGGSDA